MAKSKGAAFDSCVSIEIISYRRRLADADGVSAKAVIDGLIASGILRGDTTKDIREPILMRQVKVKTESEEKTVIIITELEGET